MFIGYRGYASLGLPLPSRIGKDGLMHWSRADKYASLVCYRYCIKYDICPGDFLYYLRRIYTKCASRRLMGFYRLQDESTDLFLTMNFDPYASIKLKDGDMEVSAFESYFGGIDLSSTDFDELIERLVNDPSKEAHRNEWSQHAQDAVKTKKLNDYKQRQTCVLRTFKPPKLPDWLERKLSQR